MVEQNGVGQSSLALSTWSGLSLRGDGKLSALTSAPEMCMGMGFPGEWECRKIHGSKIPIAVRFQAQMNPLINSE